MTGACWPEGAFGGRIPSYDYQSFPWLLLQIILYRSRTSRIPLTSNQNLLCYFRQIHPLRSGTEVTPFHTVMPIVCSINGMVSN